MPTISFKKGYLESITGFSLPVEEWEEKFALVKGELKEFDSVKDEIKVELADSNRPDLWSCEGIARQILIKEKGSARKDYSFFGQDKEKLGGRQVIISEDLKTIRPYIATCCATGAKITEDVLLNLIQTQEKIAENYGKKREIVSIGIYNLNKIKFPVHYKAVKPNELSFVPLGFDARMNLSEILEFHPKGVQYKHIVSKFEKYPVLVDDEGKILSFPPVINSRDLGEVKPGDQDLFIEVTGTDMRQVMLALNIFAVNMSDLGAEIFPVLSSYSYDTGAGKEIITPKDNSGWMRIEINKIERMLGEQVTPREAEEMLLAYGYQAKTAGAGILELKAPPYRDDIMADVDVIEDFAISAGYDYFEPVMPTDYTIGGLSDNEITTDKIREYLIGFGFQELISNILCSKESMTSDMLYHNNKVIEVDNVMSLNYSVLRNWITPMLLRVEQASSKAFYPHKIFEAGDVAVFDENNVMKTRTNKNVAAVIAHANASFSEIHSVLDLLFYYMNLDYKLEHTVHPSFIEGRVGNIVVNGKVIGFIGELHPQVLENWQIMVPAVSFEIIIDDILSTEG